MTCSQAREDALVPCQLHTVSPFDPLLLTVLYILSQVEGFEEALCHESLSAPPVSKAKYNPYILLNDIWCTHIY